MEEGPEEIADVRVPLAHYAWREIVLFALLPLAVSLGLIAGWVLGGPSWLAAAGGIGAALSIGAGSFFRDPSRTPPEGEERVLAPADGKVVGVREVEGDDFLGEKGLEVDIFLSIFNAHVNRAPVAGVVRGITYRKGSFVSALRGRASEVNEKNTVEIEGEGYRVVVRQIAGAVARRIVCACKVGESLRRGERFGMIKFGSRTQVVLPAAIFVPEVRPGDHVKAGVSVIGKIRSGERR